MSHLKDTFVQSILGHTLCKPTLLEADLDFLECKLLERQLKNIDVRLVRVFLVLANTSGRRLCNQMNFFPPEKLEVNY